MAADNAKPTSSKVAFGRGGAGNIGPISPSLKPTDLQTPTIKQAHYTTGRGGSGNIVSNDSADNARKAQDVDAPLSLAEKKEGGSDGFHGRGGAANVVRKVKDAVTGKKE